MQILLLNELVAKKQENFFLPQELADFISAELDRIGKKRKWMFYAAAILSFMERVAADREDRIGEIGKADTRHTFAPLIERARLIAEPPVYAEDVQSKAEAQSPSLSPDESHRPKRRRGGKGASKRRAK